MSDSCTHGAPDKIGAFTILRRIGSGGMGDVYLVEDPDDGVRYAVKKIRASFSDYIHLQRFRREFRALRSLEHPGIVRVFDFFGDNTPGYFVMEYVDGITLESLYRQNLWEQPDGVQRCLRICLQVCDVLEYIHERRMVHRDLKPSNIIVQGSNESDRVKLLDFGLIHLQGGRTVLTEAQSIVGSALYMSPEQARGDPVDPRSDLYSLGVLLYEGLMGHPPFMSDNPVALIGMHQIKPPVPLRTMRPEIQPALENLVLALLEKNPQDRPASARETAEALRCVMRAPVAAGDSKRPKLPAGGHLFEPALTGRGDVMSSIVEGIDALHPGESGIFIVAGEAGIGKTRLITQIVRQLESQGCRPAFGAFQEADYYVYGGISRAMHAYVSSSGNALLKDVENDPDRNELLRRLIDPQITPQEEGSRETASDDSIRETACLILDLLVEGVSGTRIVCLEDVQFSGRESVKLLTALIREHHFGRSDGRGQPSLAVLCTARSDSLAVSQPWKWFMENLSRPKAVREIFLTRLSRIQVSDMAESMLGHALNDISVEVLNRCTEGIPLYVSELLKHAADHRWITFRDGSWNLDIPSDGAILDRVEQILHQRFAVAGDNEWTLLRAAAVLGCEFSGTVHEQICGMQERVYLDTFDTLLRHQKFRELSGNPDGYRFDHSILREYVLKKSSRRRLQSLHRKAAAALISQDPDHPGSRAESIANHLESGLQYTAAYHYRWHAAEKAQAAGCPLRVLAQLKKAEGDLKAGDFNRKDRRIESIRLGIELGAMERRFGNVDRAETLLREACRLAQDEEDDHSRGRALMQMGVIHGTQGQFDKARPLLLEALEIFQRTGDRCLESDSLNNLGAGASAAGFEDLSAEYHEASLAVSREIMASKKVARSLLNLAYLACDAGQEEVALRRMKQSLDIARSLKNRRLAAYSLYGLAGLTYDRAADIEGWGRVLALLDEAIDVLENSGDGAILANGLYLRVKTKQKLGQQFDRDKQRAFKVAQEMGIKELVESIQSCRTE
jgi:tetratricopeptide (TPR) repeat protein